MSEEAKPLSLTQDEQFRWGREPILSIVIRDSRKIYAENLDLQKRLEAAEARIARYKERDALCGNCHGLTRHTPCAKCGGFRP